MPAFASVADQLALLTRGTVDVHTRTELEERLTRSRQTGTPLRVKAGFDPTRPDLHIGHTVLMSKMRQFQDLGHTAVLVIGDFTAMVGDPTGQNAMRPRLTREQVAAAAATYTEQAFKVLDPARTELRANSEWLESLTASSLVELMSKITVARMLERNDFAARFRDQQPIFQHEFLYPLLQGYDSIALKSDIELGGADQLFNLLVGRDLMPKYGLTPQLIMTVPLLEGIDARIDADGRVIGKKMSKSADNFIAITEAPLDMVRKVMQIDDDAIFRYFELLSARSNEEIVELKQARAEGRNPMEIKALFAREIVERFHGANAATEALEQFRQVYANDALPDTIPEHALTTETPTLWLAKALSLAGLTKSSGEGRRLLEQGGVEVDRTRVTDPQFQLEPGKRYLIRIGSKHRRFAYITVTAS